MLLTRILTALVLLPLVIGAIFWLPTTGVAVVLGVFLGIGAWEWGLLTRLANPGARIVFTLITLAAFVLLWWQMGATATIAIIWLAVLWWILAVFILLRFPRGWDVSVGLPPVAGLLGLLLLCAPFVALVRLHGGVAGPQLMLCLLVLIWAADTGAYFAGRALGRHKLAPRVSPGKTVEGAVGGIALTLVAAALGAWWFGYAGGQAFGFVLLGGITALFSIVGDLTISMFKRQAGVKDSGRIFPGHGGVLDRLDSLLAAAPCFVLGYALLGL